MLRTKLELKHGRRESKLEEFVEVKEDGAMVVASKCIIINLVMS